MTYETIRIDVAENGIATLTLARPDKHNALSAQMIDELTSAARALDGNDAVRVVILTGEGKSFCAGGDLGWMREQMDADSEARRREARKLAEMLGALNGMSKPLIGAVGGNAFGGGVGMMSVCDVVIASRDARFGLTETRLGLIPATIGPYVLARMGEGKARRVFMSARLFDANEARDLDLVARVVAADDVIDEAMNEARHYLACAPGAVGRAKALARELGGRITPQIIDHTINSLADTWEADEAREGVSAFFEKRKPKWSAE